RAVEEDLRVLRHGQLQVDGVIHRRLRVRTRYRRVHVVVVVHHGRGGVRVTVPGTVAAVVRGVGAVPAIAVAAIGVAAPVAIAAQAIAQQPADQPVAAIAIAIAVVGPVVAVAIAAVAVAAIPGAVVGPICGVGASVDAGIGPVVVGAVIPQV